MATPYTPQAQRSSSGYREIERIQDADGVLAILSLRTTGVPLVSIALFKTFVRDGIEEKTSFFSPKHAPAIKRVVDIAAVRARELEDKFQAEYELEARRKVSR